jgi:hypothetical protein
MKSLEMLIGSKKYSLLSDRERRKIQELIDANPVFTHLVAGIIGTDDWRKVLGEAYLKYVKGLSLEQISLYKQRLVRRTAQIDEKTNTRVML